MKNATPATIQPNSESYLNKVSTVLLYSIVLVSSIFIGADCAINAANYLGQIPMFAQVTIFIVIAALSGFVLNLLLYALDAPGELSALPGSLADDFEYMGVAFGILSTESAGYSRKDAWKALGSTSFCTFIALGSAAIMGLFTYQTYLTFQLNIGGGAYSFATSLVIAMCLAYAVLTFTLIRGALNSCFKIVGPAKVLRMQKDFERYQSSKVKSDVNITNGSTCYSSAQYSGIEQSVLDNVQKVFQKLTTNNAKAAVLFFFENRDQYNGTDVKALQSFILAREQQVVQPDKIEGKSTKVADVKRLSSGDLNAVLQLSGYECPPSAIKKMYDCIVCGKVWTKGTSQFESPNTDSNKIIEVVKGIGRTLFFIILFAIGAIATAYTAWTWALATQAALVSLGLPVNGAWVFAGIFAGLILIGELVFTFNTCTWVGIRCLGLTQSKEAESTQGGSDNKNSNNNKESKKTPKKWALWQWGAQILFMALFVVFILANALGNAAIACNGSATMWGTVVAVFGGILSLMIMTKTFGDSTDETFTFTSLYAEMKKNFSSKAKVSFFKPLLISLCIISALVVVQLQGWQMIDLSPLRLGLCLGMLALVVLLLQFVPSAPVSAPDAVMGGGGAPKKSSQMNPPNASNNNVKVDRQEENGFDSGLPVCTIS